MSISEKQNEKRHLQQLAAQRYLYSKAKKVFALHFTLAVPLVFFFLIISIFIEELQIFSTAWGVSISLIGYFLLSHAEEKIRYNAAMIQELFDCEVLDLPWNGILIDHPPDEEDIIENSEKYEKIKHKFHPLKDWYPKDVDQFPISKARIICQRSNVWWDAHQRLRYISALKVLLITIPIILAFVGLIFRMEWEQVILYLFTPIMPFVLIGIQQYHSHKNSADKLDRLKKIGDQLIKTVVDSKESEDLLNFKARCFQDELFKHRSQNPSVFDWIYKRFRDENEFKMNKSAGALINEIGEK